MDNMIRQTLIDARDTLEHIVSTTEWESLQEGSSAKEIIHNIDAILEG